MNSDKSVKMDERTIAVARAANTWGLAFIGFALLLDIMYRSAVFHEAPWDLFALVVMSGVVSAGYMARHKVLWQVYSKKMLILMVVVAIVAAALGAILAAGRVM